MTYRCMMDIFLEHLDAVNREAVMKDTDVGRSRFLFAMACRSRFLNLMANFISQPAIKCTLLQLIW